MQQLLLNAAILLNAAALLNAAVLLKGQLQCQNKFCSKGSLLVIMIHGINYFFIICLDEAIIELENSTLRLRFISGSNH